MGKVRPFTKTDIPQVVDLHPRAFADSTRPPGNYFEDVFLNHPWLDEKFCSLVYEQDDGKIVGFMGVMPRHFIFGKRPIRAAISSQFMVDPLSRSTMAGLKLLRTFLSGPQDLSLADASNDSGSEMWEALKGQRVWVQSVQWHRNLRAAPSRHLRAILAKRRFTAPLGKRLSIPLAALDVLAEGVFRRRMRPISPNAIEVEIDEKGMMTCWDQISHGQALRPHYDEGSLKWLVTRAASKRQHGKLQSVGVHNAAGEIVGWYIYYMNQGDDCRVLQLAAREGSVKIVLDSLIYHAWKGGAKSLYGWLEPRLMREFASRPRISYRLTRYWMVVHARESELIAAIHRGDSFLSQLEGEWTMGFHGENF